MLVHSKKVHHSAGSGRVGKNLEKSLREVAVQRRSEEIVDKFQKLERTVVRENGRNTDRQANNPSRVLLERYQPLKRTPVLSVFGEIAKCVMAVFGVHGKETNAVAELDESGKVKSFEAQQSKDLGFSLPDRETFGYAVREDGSKSYTLEKLGLQESVTESPNGTLTYDVAQIRRA